MKKIMLGAALMATVMFAVSFAPSNPNKTSFKGNDLTNPTIGEVTMFAGNFAPRGWALCDGQLLPISQHQALFSILGTTYGGDGRSTFALPDLRGRTPIHVGRGPGLSDYRLGAKGGAETVTLTANQMPAHKHDIEAKLYVSDVEPTIKDGTDNVFGASNIYAVDGRAVSALRGGTIRSSIGDSGGGQAHENRAPYLGINYIIALQGTFPSRN